MSSIDRATADLVAAALRELAGETVGEVRAVLDGEHAAWIAERVVTGALDAPLGPNPWRSSDGASARLAAAIGRALAGSRATAYCGGPDLAACRDPLRVAVARSVPLVLHAALRASVAQGVPLGTGHDALTELSGVGAVVFVCRDVQDVADLSILARRVAETARVPVVVAQDLCETAHSPATVMISTQARVSAYLGDPTQGVEPHDPAERMLFGSLRRRMVRLVDAERPATFGAVVGSEAWAQMAISQTLFGSARVTRALSVAAEEWKHATGRGVDTIAVSGASRPRVTILAAGYVAALCERLLDVLPHRVGKTIRVVSLQRLRPLDETAIVSALGGCRHVAVLERTTPVDGTTPLAREIRATLARAVERDRKRDGPSPGPSLRDKDRPRVHGVSVGLGGASVRFADLAELCTRLTGDEPVPETLGVKVAPLSTSYPKRRVLAERLRREYPGIEHESLAAASAESPPNDDAIALSVIEPGGSRVGGALTELLSHAAGSARSLVRHRPDGSRSTRIAAAQRDAPVTADDSHAGMTLHVADIPTAARDLDEERLLGAVAARLVAHHALLSERKIVAARERALEALPATDRDERMRVFRDALTGAEAPDASLASFEGRVDPIAAEAVSDVPVRAEWSARHDDTLTSISRFWHQVGVLYRDDRLDELSPDPYVGSGALPPLSAAIGRSTPTTLPELDAARCVGCGDCWTACPEGALGVTLLTPKELLERGIDEASRNGVDAGALRMILGKLAPRVAKVSGGDEPPARAGDVVRAAFESLAEKLPDQRRDALGEAARGVADALDRLPLSRTQPLFDDAEAEEPGAGTLLSILADPETCTSCGLCTAACEEEALPQATLTREAYSDAFQAWALWSRLPDPGGPVLSRMARHANVGIAAATFASRHASMAIASARRDGSGSGESLALRLVLGAAELARQPVVAALGREIEGLRGALAAEVQKTLAGALPTDDLEALSTGLSFTDAHEVSLADIASRLESAEREQRVDRDRLAALVDTARRLADLNWRVVTGADGTGRARMGVVVMGEGLADRIARFPDNALAAPAVVDVSSQAAYTALGLARGLGDTIVEDIRLMRRAQLLLDRSLPEADAESEALAALSWDTLSDDERRWCTPLVVLCDEAALGRDVATVAELLLSETRPVTLVLITEADARSESRGRELALLGLAAGRAALVQSSPGAPDHLVQGVRECLSRSGPSIVRVHAPSPARHGFATDGAMERAELAIAARVHPLLRYDPGAGGVFGAGLDLDGNPDPIAHWCSSGEGRCRTPADWAEGESRFCASLGALEDHPSPTLVAEFLNLSDSERAGRTPVLRAPEEGTERVVAPSLLAWCAERLRTWRTLQELGGVVTPFVTDVRDAAQRDVAERHAAEVESLKEDHAREVRQLRETVRGEFLSTVRERLVLLATRGRSANGRHQ